jgi:hypothetical protein
MEHRGDQAARLHSRSIGHPVAFDKSLLMQERECKINILNARMPFFPPSQEKSMQIKFIILNAE